MCGIAFLTHFQLWSLIVSFRVLRLHGVGNGAVLLRLSVNVYGMSHVHYAFARFLLSLTLSMFCPPPCLELFLAWWAVFLRLSVVMAIAAYGSRTCWGGGVWRIAEKLTLALTQTCWHTFEILLPSDIYIYGAFGCCVVLHLIIFY